MGESSRARCLASRMLMMLPKWHSSKLSFHQGMSKIKSSGRWTNASQGARGFGLLGEPGEEGSCAKGSMSMVLPSSPLFISNSKVAASGRYCPGGADLGLGDFHSFLPPKVVQAAAMGRIRSEGEGDDEGEGEVVMKINP